MGRLLLVVQVVDGVQAAFVPVFLVDLQRVEYKFCLFVEGEELLGISFLVRGCRNFFEVFISFVLWHLQQRILHLIMC
jgi:hypothetical protein